MDSISSSDRFEQLERRLARAERRLRATWSLAFVGTFGAFVLGANPQARAQFGVTLSSLNNRLTAVEIRATNLETKTQYVTVTGTDMLITGANLHIRSGSGATNGNLSRFVSTDPNDTSVNGLGNLIIGYNETLFARGDERGGSHNLVIGLLHDYTSFGGMVAGYGNRITAPFASVRGGANNQATSLWASVGGGNNNRAFGQYSTVSAGNNNQANADFSAISGGSGRTISALFGWVAGSEANNGFTSGNFSSP